MGFAGGQIKGVGPKGIKALNNRLMKMERAITGNPRINIKETDVERIRKYFEAQDDNNNPTLASPTLLSDIDMDKIEYIDSSDSDDESAIEEREYLDLSNPIDLDFTDGDCNFTEEYPIYGWEAPVVPVEWFEIRAENANWGVNNDNLIRKIPGTSNIFEWKNYSAWCTKKGYATKDVHLTFNSDCEFNGYWDAQGTPTTCERSSAQYYQGAYSWRVVHAVQGWKGVGQDFTTPTAAIVIAIRGKVYIVSGGPVRVGLYDASTGWWTGYSTITPTGSWETVTIYQTVPAGAAATSYLLAEFANAVGEFHIDDMSAIQCARRYITLYIKAIGKNGRYSASAGSVTLYNDPPDMRDYTVGGSTTKKTRLITANWNDWTNVDDEKIAKYHVYCSTVVPSDADDDSNLAGVVTKKTSSFLIAGKQVKVAHDVRVVPYDLYGRGFASK